MVRRRRWLTRTALLAGAGLLALALAATTSAAPERAGKTGGTFVVELSTDIDYIDPQLDYLSSG